MLNVYTDRRYFKNGGGKAIRSKSTGFNMSCIYVSDCSKVNNGKYTTIINGNGTLKQTVGLGVKQSKISCHTCRKFTRGGTVIDD